MERILRTIPTGERGTMDIGTATAGATGNVADELQDAGFRSG